MSERLDPDKSKVCFDEPTTALGNALRPEDGQVLQSLLLGLNCQYKLDLRADGHAGTRIVRMTPIRDDITYFQVLAWVTWLFWDIFHRLFPIQERHVLVVMGHDYEVLPPRPDGNYSVA